MRKLKVALVCEWLTEVGGAEQVLLEFHKLFPDAPIYTSQYREGRIDWFSDGKIKTGYLNFLPVKLRRFMAPLRQRYFKKIDLTGYDLVISVTGSDAKFVKTDGVHLCYCHVPTQYYWGKYEEYLKNPGFGILNPIVRSVFKKMSPKLRENDFEASKNPTKFLTISKYAKEEIKRFYKREAKIISPPVNTELFSQYVDNLNIKKGKSQIKKDYNNVIKIKKSQTKIWTYKNIEIDISQGSKSEQKFYTNLKNVENLDAVVEILTKYPSGFYLNFSRQVSWKNLDLIVKVCKKLKLSLVLVGDGPEHKKLKKLADDSPFITFLEPLKQTDLAFLSSLAKAFIFPSEEPFGIAPVEAMSAGCPVISLKKGGALDYIKEGTNGFFFEELAEESLEKVLKEFEEKVIPLDRNEVSKSVEKFSKKKFEEKIKKEISKVRVIPSKKSAMRAEADESFLIKFRRWIFITFPAVLFFSNWPMFRLGENESMHFKLTLPLIWLAIFAILNLRSAGLFLKKNFKTPFILTLIPLLALLWTSDKTRGILTAGIAVCIGISILGVRDLVKDRQIMRQFKKALLLATVFVCLFCILQIMLDTIGASRELALLCPNCTSEVFGFAHPNGFAAEPQFMGSLLLIPTILALNSLLENKNRKSQIKYLLVATLSILTIFLTLSRGAIFGFLIAFLVLMICKIRQIKKIIGVIILVFITFILSLNVQGLCSSLGPTNANYVTGINHALSQLTFDRLGHTEPEEKQEKSTDFDGYVAESTDRRLELAGYALQITTESPTNLLFGTGIGSAGTEMLKRFPSQGHAKEIVQNQYLEALLEIGVVGIVMLGLGIITFIKLEQLKITSVSLAILFGFMIEIIFFSGFPNALHIYLLPLMIYNIKYD